MINRRRTAPGGAAARVAYAEAGGGHLWCSRRSPRTRESATRSANYEIQIGRTRREWARCRAALNGGSPRRRRCTTDSASLHGKGLPDLFSPRPPAATSCSFPRPTKNMSRRPPPPPPPPPARPPAPRPRARDEAVPRSSKIYEAMSRGRYDDQPILDDTPRRTTTPHTPPWSASRGGAPSAFRGAPGPG